MPLIRRCGLTVFAGSMAFLGLSAVFGLYCVIGGHNAMEALYGDFATYLLSVVAGVEIAWLYGR